MGSGHPQLPRPPASGVRSGSPGSRRGGRPGTEKAERGASPAGSRGPAAGVRRRQRPPAAAPREHSPRRAHSRDPDPEPLPSRRRRRQKAGTRRGSGRPGSPRGGAAGGSGGPGKAASAPRDPIGPAAVVRPGPSRPGQRTGSAPRAWTQSEQAGRPGALGRGRGSNLCPSLTPFARSQNPKFIFCEGDRWPVPDRPPPPTLPSRLLAAQRELRSRCLTPGVFPAPGTGLVPRPGKG